jgi:hemerythrin-like domain-containing protein
MKCTWGDLQACRECLHAPNLPEKYNGYLNDHESIRKIVCRLGILVKEVNRGQRDKFGVLYRQIEAFKNMCEHHIAIEERVVFPVIEESWSWEVVEYLSNEHMAIKQSLANILLISSILKQSDTIEPHLWKNCEEALWDIIALLREHWYKEEFGLLPLVIRVLDENKQQIICSVFRNS